MVENKMNRRKHVRNSYLQKIGKQIYPKGDKQSHNKQVNKHRLLKKENIKRKVNSWKFKT